MEKMSQLIIFVVYNNPCIAQGKDLHVLPTDSSTEKSFMVLPISEQLPLNKMAS